MVCLMGFHPDIVHSAAEEQDLPRDRVGNTLQRIRNYAGDNLEEYLQTARDPHQEGVYLADVNQSYIVALATHHWEELADHLVIDEPMLQAVKTIHRQHVENTLDSLDHTDIPTNTTPFVIDYPKNWVRARGAVHGHWGYFFHQGLSPAEVVDYWMIEKTEFTPDNWAKIRDVQPEAVRKNVRQAKEKLPRDLPL